MANIDILKNYNHIHMIGIGGVSMSGIAEILHHFGLFVTGSDCSRSKITDRLTSHGIFVSIGHSTSLVEKADLDALRSLLINLTCEPIFYNEY